MYHSQPKAHTMPTGKTLEAFPLKSTIRQECPQSLLLFNIVLDLIDSEIRKQEPKNWKAES